VEKQRATKKPEAGNGEISRQLKGRHFKERISMGNASNVSAADRKGKERWQLI